MITGEKSEWRRRVEKRGVRNESAFDKRLLLMMMLKDSLSKEESRSEKEDKKLDTKIQEERKREVKKECSHLTPLFSYTTSLYFIRRLSEREREREMVKQVPV